MTTVKDCHCNYFVYLVTVIMSTVVTYLSGRVETRGPLQTCPAGREKTGAASPVTNKMR